MHLVAWGTDGAWNMNISNSEYAEWWIDQVMSQIETNHDDGLFADSFGWPTELWGCGPGHSVPPVPCGVQPEYEAWWTAALEQHLQFIKQRFATKGYKLIPNPTSLITSRDKTDLSIAVRDHHLFSIPTTHSRCLNSYCPSLPKL